MRRILIESARRRRRLRHGGQYEKVSADETPLEVAAPVEDDDLLGVHDAVDALERHDPRKAQLVKYRYSAGLEVIDFGIAKATQGRLGAATIVTAFEQFIGTPVYMSPDQPDMSSLDVDTRSDIYSLGCCCSSSLPGARLSTRRQFSREAIETSAGAFAKPSRSDRRNA